MTEQTWQSPTTDVREAVITALRTLLGDRLMTGIAVRDHHSHGEGLPATGLPDAVAFPHSNEDVAAIARACNEAGMPLVPFGAGTSLEGHVAAVRGGICLDLTQMDAVLSVSPEALDCRVQAGVTRRRLNAELRSHGLFFPVDPGADATIGGMAATRASGTTAVRYGTMRENVLGLTIVTADGRIVRTGGRARKSAAGLDLTRLFVGSEGTLGVITEIQLRLQGLPETVIAAVCQFDTLADAANTVIAAMQMGVPLAAIELLNDVQMDACIRYSHLDEFSAKPTLFLNSRVARRRRRIRSRRCRRCARTPAAVCSASPHCRKSARGCGRRDTRSIILASPMRRARRTWEPMPACLSPSWPTCIAETEADITASRLIAPIVGHAGDGNFHLGIMYDPDDEDETRRAENLARRVGERAIRFGGTCTGEHGIGLHKRDLLEQEIGNAVDLMRTIKQSFDPRDIMNPGKMLNEAPSPPASLEVSS